MTGKRLSPKEANAALPLVARITADLVDVTGRLRAAETHYRAEKARIPPSQLALNDGSRLLRGLRSERDACVAELTDLSVGVDDDVRGDVHFAGVLGDDPVLLCWRLGELRVDTWRREGEPFASRRPLPELVGTA